MATGRILVKKALQKAKIITKNEDPAADEINDGLDSLNDMLASWSADSLTCFAYSLESFPLTGADQYTIGNGQNFNTSRPTRIVSAVLRWNTHDYPLAVVSPETFEQYITDKDTQGLPEFITYDNGFPVGTIRIYPRPLTGYELRLMMEKPLGAFTLDDVVTLPPGWNRAIIFNLAEELRSEYGMDADPKITAIAMEAKGNIKRATARARPMDTTPVAPYGTRNIYTGYW